MSLPTSAASVGQKRTSEGITGDERNNRGGEENLEPNKKKRRQVKRACLNCRIAHAACDNGRPCTRCVQYGLEVSCLDVERKNSKKRKESGLGQLGQLGTIAGLNQLLQIPGIVNAMGPPQPPPTPPHSTPYQQSPAHTLDQTGQQRTDIPHNVYLTHEYFPILSQLAAQQHTLLQAINHMNQPKTSPSPSPSPHHSQQTYNHTYLPPILPNPPGNSMANFVNNARASSSGLANIQMQLAQSSPRREVPNLPPPMPRQPTSPTSATYNQYGTFDPSENQNSSPPSPPPRIFKPQLLQQALAQVQMPQSRLQTPDVFIETDEIDIVTKNPGEDLSSFFIDDYFTKMIMQGDEHQDHVHQSFDEEDIHNDSGFTPSDSIKICTQDFGNSSGCVVFPLQPVNDHNHDHKEAMCVAVWELEGSLFSANGQFLEIFKVPHNIRLAKKNGEVNDGPVLFFEDLMPKSDVMFKAMFKAILSGKTPSYTGPIQFVDYERSKGDSGQERLLHGFASCYLVRGGIHQEPRYVVTHVSLIM